ncbi:uncharacterized protein LOC116259342 [Nymphaea colorata]|nr:uncharacterized protein LOC116259342 [Nymphaea colorata]XP_031492981.1 uncharacterized protein LOC116259342 [Nymphaea colorata]XP_031492989.1 uncharacterized protein LOC116259342 [Nymphaea colorata]XP_031492997.1 uncharacterized protein LOC116259342 [Nymphaea colorata]XP_031493004.1 uncharacterized protein LOC116259342 [Nymphaea colorata]
MEEDTLLQAIYEDEALDFEDVEMADVEDGQELPEHVEDVTGTAEGDDSLRGKTEDVKMVSRKRRRKSRKRDKNLNGARKDDSTYMDSFVLETSRRLNEKKIHLVREAVKYLGLAAVNDLVAEVDTIQKCGGQMTVDGTRQRTGGGILWNILRLRDRKAYREIMARGKKFMRQRKQVRVMDKLQKETVETPHSSDMATSECLKNSSTAEPVQDELSKHDSPQNRVSVWHRVRVPVSYGDLVDDGTEEGEITE